MPSSITLTVSQLAQSTSFFLSILQPLGYIYRGHACSSTIAFGPTDLSVAPDFWLTQATPTVPAGAAHVAFPAPSRQAVQDFFHTSLRAGAAVHGEPCVRDSHGYYSAAIIDFDGNSIEAVYRPIEHVRRDATGDTCSTVSKSSRRAHSTTSRAPSSFKQESNSVVKASATEAIPAKEPTKGDALDTILAQARSAADMAKQLVDSVRPNLSSSTSAPVVPSSAHVDNKDAFAKSGDATNTVMGTLLGVAAGAAMTYAITSRNSSSSPSSESGGQDHKSRDHRPGLARSATVPHFDHSSAHGRSAHNGHRITLQDNDKHTAISSSTARPDPRHRRRSSFDSGIGPSPPSSTSTTRSSRKTRPGMIEAPQPPPSAYKTPASAIEGASISRSRSKTRASTEHKNEGASHNPRHRSRSESRSRSKHHRHDSGYSENGYETVLHVTTHQAFGTPAPPHHSTPSTQKSEKPKQTDKPSKSWSNNKTLPLPMLSALSSHHETTRKESDRDHPRRSSSRTRSKASTVTVRPEQYPLPLSRAATWTGERDRHSPEHKRAMEGGRSGGSGGPGSHVSARSGLGSGRPPSRERVANTVIGKMRDVRSLKVRKGEVRPEDSVSQIG